MKALVTAEMDQKWVEELKKFTEVTIAGWGKELRKLGEEELMDLLEGQDILITSYDAVTKKVIEKSKDLKLIACTRANPVNIDIQTARERNIPVIYTPGRNSDCTAEFTIGMMMSIARKIPMAYKALKDGYYIEENKPELYTKDGLKRDVTWSLGGGSPYVIFKGDQLKGKILGLLGYGSIGKRVAEIAKAIGMYIYVYDPYISEIEIDNNNQKKVSWEELISQSDFISSHMKVTPETTGLLGEKEFKKMKNTAYVINTSRGAVIDEKALIHALRNKEIAGAALDVFEIEPLYKEHPFIKELDNIVITPHLGGATYDAIENHSKMIVKDVERFINKERLLYEFK